MTGARTRTAGTDLGEGSIPRSASAGAIRRLPGMQDAVVAVQSVAAGMTVPPPSGPYPGSTFNVKVLLRSFSAWNLPLTPVTLPACLIRTFQCVGLGTPPKPPQ